MALLNRGSRTGEGQNHETTEAYLDRCCWGESEKILNASCYCQLTNCIWVFTSECLADNWFRPQGEPINKHLVHGFMIYIELDVSLPVVLWELRMEMQNEKKRNKEIPRANSRQSVTTFLWRQLPQHQTEKHVKSSAIVRVWGQTRLHPLHEIISLTEAHSLLRRHSSIIGFMLLWFLTI